MASAHSGELNGCVLAFHYICDQIIVSYGTFGIVQKDRRMAVGSFFY